MPTDVSADDPFLWLEEADGGQALAWVAANNAETEKALRDHTFECVGVGTDNARIAINTALGFAFLRKTVAAS